VKSASDDDYSVLRQSVVPTAANLAIKWPSNKGAEKLLRSYAATGAAEPKAIEALTRQWDKLGVKRIIGHLDEASYGPHFNPDAKILAVSKDDLGVLAHETGHAKNWKTVKKLFGKNGPLLHNLMYGLSRAGSKLSTGVASLTALFGADDDTVRNIGIAGSAAAVPMLAEEIVASARGANMLRKLKLPGKARAFSGLPSYLITAAAPMTPWLGMKAYDKITED
jgi:hypothetical protein